jgi:lysophospholipase L1-like esterase
MRLPRREWLVRIALVALSLAVSLLFIEITLRAFGYAPERYKSMAFLRSSDGSLLLDCYPTNPRGYFDIDLRRPAARSKYSALAPRRFDVVSRRAPWAVECRYNSRGFRDAEPGPKRRDVLRVAVMGDSFTEGQGVKEHDAFPRVLERLLNAARRQRYEVLNCGRRATDFPELFALFEQVERLDPDLLIFAMVPNDAERSDAFEARQRYVNDWIMDRGRMLIGRPDERLRLFDSRLAAFLKDRIDAYRVGRETTRWYKDMWGPANEEGRRRTQEYVREMNRRVRARGGQFLIASWPRLIGLEDDYPFNDVTTAIDRICLATGVQHHDLLPALRGRQTRSLWVHPVDRHANEEAHRLVADSLAPVVLRLMRSEPRANR